MTEKLFIENAYTNSDSSVVKECYQNEVILDKTIFYPIGGGQPGDTGTFKWGNKEAKIINTYSNRDNSIVHIVDESDPIPISGESIDISIDWEKRYLHMRMHTGLHLLGSILKYGVTGGNISASKSRLDFDMEDAVDKEYVNAELERLVDEDTQAFNNVINAFRLPEKSKEEQKIKSLQDGICYRCRSCWWK